jgi:quercetin dioxygenase-like cupin family protein
MPASVGKIEAKFELEKVKLMQHPYTYIENLSNQVADIPADSIISRTLFSDEGIKVVLFGFAQGQELSEHTASQPAIIQLIAGEATLTLGKDKHNAKAGTWVHMPPNLPHSVEAKTEVTMLLTLLKQ